MTLPLRAFGPAGPRVAVVGQGTWHAEQSPRDAVAALRHWRGAHPLAETIAGFEELYCSGKIRAWGVSNFDVDDLEELASLKGAGLPACNQVLYHLEERAIEHTVLPWCHDRGVAIVAYTPFGESAQAFDPHTRHGRVLREIAASHGATARQVALAFLLRHAFVIPKAARRDHAADNAGAGALHLTDADCARIDAAFPRGKARALPML
jgi:diketogulonate reductase-like aldo/keto reductase